MQFFSNNQVFTHKNYFFLSMNRIPLCMKLFIALLVFSASILHAEIVYSQSGSVNLNFTNTAIENILTEIETQTGYTFFYNNKNVDVAKKVSLSAAKKSLSSILDELFAGTNIEYVTKGTNIVLRAKEQQQKKYQIKGLVTDDRGEPIIGASVSVKGEAGNGVITDFDGNFTLTTTAGKVTLEISYIGYKSVVVEATSGKPVRVKLQEDNQVLNEVVVVGYGTQKKESVVGSVQMVKPKELHVPSSNLSTGFAGRLAGVVAVQRSGEPGADGADFWIRGISTFNGSKNPLIVIDGVQASSGDLNALDPEIIESFSVLKDATATALYGSRGANGVMIVNTKSGRESEKAIVNVRIENSYSTHTRTPEFVDGVRYMEMYNEAVLSRKTGEVLYPQAKIDGTRAGLNPMIFPNVDWYNELFRKGAMNQNVNVNVRGGYKKLDYFSSVSVNHDNGVLRNTKDFSYNSNLNIMRYVFQNNINLSLSNTSKLSLHLNVQLKDYSGPASSASDLFGMVMEANPVDFPVRYPADPESDYIRWGGKVGGKFNNGYRNPYAEMARGYKSDFESTVMANLKFEQKLDFITEGLSAEALFSFKNWSQSSTKRDSGYNQFQLVTYKPNDLSNYTLSRVGEEVSTVLGTENKSSGDRRIYLQAMVNYNRTFGGVHNVSGMFLYNQDQYNTNNPEDLIGSLPQRKQGIAGRLTYAYDYRYLAEVNFGYNGSENFAEGHRFGFFPSFALGYAISREKFFERFSNTITNLKLRASWGLVGNDQIGGERYLYLSDIELQHDDMIYTTGRDQNVDKKGPRYKRYSNPTITWEVGSKWNVGIDLGLWNDLNITADVFREVRSDIFMERRRVPDFIGTNANDKWINLKTKMYGNLGKVENKGMDFSVDYMKGFNKDFSMSLKGTFTFAQNKVLAYDEPDFQKYPNLSRVGHPIDQPLLYIAERLFVDDAEVNRNPIQNIGGKVMAGDIKYKNLADIYGNYDGVIDANDRQYTGMPTTPEIVYGFGPSFRYKDFDFSFFLQGAARVSIMMKQFHPFGSEGTRSVLKFIADDYWTADNQNIHAGYPRLSKTDNANNTVASTYWQRDGSFLKLKNAEVGYNHKFFRVYLRGSNLLTFSKFKYWDPEQGSGNGLFYPTQRVINLGIQLSFNK